MSIAIPITAAIIMAGLFILQQAYLDDRKSNDHMADVRLLAEKHENLSKEFVEYKKRVDALTIRAGFKL